MTTMPSNWNVQDESDIEKLQHTYDEWKAELDEALEEEGEYSRRYRNAEYLFRIAERRLETAQSRIKRREESQQRSAKEIVDDVMGR
jgi:ElaB/YqjD/DUF883 family membrane-anchored ribosome-binding protein